MKQLQHARTADWLYNVFDIFLSITEQFVKHLTSSTSEQQFVQYRLRLNITSIEFGWIHPSLCPGSLVQEESER